MWGVSPELLHYPVLLVLKMIMRIKALVWGALTDDTDVLHLSLRDFRPYVAALYHLGQIELAELIVRDYLDAFTIGFNQFVASMLDFLNATATHVTAEEDTE